MPILYLPKINQRTLGSELLIVNEVHIVGITAIATVTTDYIRLLEVPLQEVPSSIIIPGLTEVITIPGTDEFKVDYANGRILFHTSKNGTTQYVTYYGRGSIVDGEDVNELQQVFLSPYTPFTIGGPTRVPTTDPNFGIANLDGTLSVNIVRPNNISAITTDDFTFPNDVTVNGDLDVKGTMTTIESTTVTIVDPIIQLNHNQPSAPNAGFLVERNSDPSVQFVWNEANLSWQLQNTSGSPILEAFNVGGINVQGTIIGYKDNATSLRVKGPQSPAEGVADVQSYSGIFYDNSYSDNGLLKTRFITGGNVEMDVEIQSPNALLLTAASGENVAAFVGIHSWTNVVINARTTADTNSICQLLIDRVDTGTQGTGNISNVNIKVNSGNLYINNGLTNSALVIPVLATDPSSLVPGTFWFDSTLSQFLGYNGVSVVILG